MGIPAPYIIDKIRERREEQQRQPAQIPLHIDVPRYDQDQPSGQYRRRELPPDGSERGIANIDYSLQPQDQGGLEYRYSTPPYSGDRTALDDAIDRCSKSTGNAYDPRTPSDRDRERRDQEAFRDWVHGRRDRF